MWATNANGNSLIELSAATGAPVKVLSGSRYGFDTPDGVFSDGTHVWVTNNSENSVTALPA